jgi:plastocyanin
LTDRFRLAVTSLALALSSACDKIPALPKRDAPAKTKAAPVTKVDDTTTSSIELGLGAKYAVTALSSFGSVVGTLRIPDSAARADSAATTVPECAAKRGRGPAALPPNKQFGNTVVWIAGAKSGKPLSVERRAEISSENCVLDPRVQAVTVGTTVNVINDDKVLHKLIFTKFGTHDTLTVTPFFNSGQIVATERLAKTPGLVEVKCVEHPWEHGFIAVFDHPYFAVTEDNGTFKIDSLAPGSYKLMVWHEGLAKPTEQQVQVPAGGVATIAR